MRDLTDSMSGRFPDAALEALRRGDPRAAENACRSRLLADPRDKVALALLPVTLLYQGRPADAVPLLERLVHEQPEESSHVVNLGLGLMELDRHDEAIQALAPASQRWPQDPAILATLGHARLQRGFARAATTDLMAALELDDSDTHVAAMLARALQESGERERGAELADRVLQAAPADQATLTELALCLVGAQRDVDAERCLVAAIAAESGAGAARVHLAQLYERQNRLQEAGAVLAPMNDSQGTDPLLRLMRGRLLRREKRLDAAIEALVKVRAELHSGPLAAEAAIELGMTLDAAGRTDEAFAAFIAGNEAALEMESGQTGGGPIHSSPGQWMLRTYTRDEVVRWSPSVAPAAQTPIFVVGFPRSGTTLLENVLDAHPALQALEEKPAVDAMISVLETRGPFDDGLAILDQDTAEEMRLAYWRRVACHVALRPDSRLVDRYPLNIARLAVIQRVFPGALMVLLIRHPCDVVLSCFMQNFRIMDGTVGFHRLDNGARIYDQMMRKWLAEVEAFAPRLLMIRYEDLVAEYEATVRRLAVFLRLAWDDRMLDPASHALSRGRIHTPSYSQVVQPIYTSAVERWRRYRHHFGEALPLLERWIRHWGYEELQP